MGVHILPCRHGKTTKRSIKHNSIDLFVYPFINFGIICTTDNLSNERLVTTKGVLFIN